MSVVTKTVCDCCGKEITGNSFRAVVEEIEKDTRDVLFGMMHEDVEEDFCDECAKKICGFIQGMTKKIDESEQKSAEEEKITPPLQKPAIEESPAEKQKDEYLEEMTELCKSMTQKQLAEHFHKSLPVISNYLKNHGLKAVPGKGGRPSKPKTEVKPKKAVEKPKPVILGFNVDRSKCKNCRFRGKVGGKMICDYMAIVGHSRGCSVENCNVSEKGNPASKKYQTDFYD